MIDQLPPASRDLPPGHQSARRAHLMSELTAAPRRVPSRRLVIGGLVTTGLAVGLAAALVLAPTAEVGGSPPVARANASEVLLRAANSAAAQPNARPRPDQFVYVESKSKQADLPGQPGDSGTRRVWLSVDGKHAGLITDGEPASKGDWVCPGKPKTPDGALIEPARGGPIDLADPPTGCYSHPAYRKNLPTATRAMRTWLYRNSHGDNPPDVQAFRTIGDSLREVYVSPAAKAAMFRAAATVPGVTVAKGAVDFVGRKGIAVGQTWHGIREELIFDAKSYELLGERQVVDYTDDSFQPSGGAEPGPTPWAPSPEMRKNLKQGVVLYTTATLKMAITDKAGQLP